MSKLGFTRYEFGNVEVWVGEGQKGVSESFPRQYCTHDSD